MLPFAAMRPTALALVAAALLAACTRTPTGDRSAPSATAPVASAHRPTAPPGAIPFLEDDYPRALAEARAKHVPIFVDAWAPWCHTCASLRTFVLQDPKLAPVAARFVWLAIDTERESNAAFVKKFPLEFWPTLWVLDAETERPILKWPGSLTTPELLTLLDDAALASERKSTGGEAGAALLRGDQAAADAKHDEAITAYRQALAIAPSDWARRGRGVDALATQLATNDPSACLALAETELPKLPLGTNAANVVTTGLGCATKLPKGTPVAGSALADAAEKMAADRAVPILADDRSGLFDALNDWLHAQGEPAKDRRATNARAWAAMLEEQAKAAPSKEARVVFDAHRMSAYFALGELTRARAMVVESEKDFPTDYNHPARLARIDLELKRLDDAQAAIGRALALAYGPRRLRLHELEARILTAKGDPAGAKRALTTAVKEGASMTLTGSYAKSLLDLRARAEKP